MRPIKECGRFVVGKKFRTTSDSTIEITKIQPRQVDTPGIFYEDEEGNTSWFCPQSTFSSSLTEVEGS